MPKRLEIWADSFHEGRWVATEIGKRFSNAPVTYERGFIPVFNIASGDRSLTIKVYGDYEAWSPKPSAIAEILQYGKPDFMLFAADEGRVLFIGEETAAVPTGNQSTQRCERVVGACLQRPPVAFAYLLPEYGLHLDGQPRRASVWPAMLAAKLSDQYTTTSLVLLFGDREHLEDYSVGEGVGLMFDLVTTHVKEYMGLPAADWAQARESTVAKARQLMLEFVRDQAPSMLKVLPGYCTNGSGLDWPPARQVSDPSAFVASNLIRYDAFLAAVYESVQTHKAYTLVTGSGSKPKGE